MSVMEKTKPAAWIEVGSTADILPRTARRYRAPVGDVAIFRTGDDMFYALIDKCPHKGGPLSQGIVHGHAVTCPLHAWNIDLATGRPQGPDSEHGCATTVPLQIRDGRIFLAAGLV